MTEPRKGPIIERTENVKKTTYLISEEQEASGPTIVRREMKGFASSHTLIINGQMFPLTETYLRELKQVLEKAIPSALILTPPQSH